MSIKTVLALFLFSSTAIAADAIPGVGPVGDVKKVHTGFAFTEGPAADADGNLYFTDIPNNRIHKMDRAGSCRCLSNRPGTATG